MRVIHRRQDLLLVGERVRWLISHLVLMLNEGRNLLCTSEVPPEGAGRQGMTRMVAEDAPERITGTSKLLEEQDERYEHWKGGREQVDVA